MKFAIDTADHVSVMNSQHMLARRHNQLEDNYFITLNMKLCLYKS